MRNIRHDLSISLSRNDIVLARLDLARRQRRADAAAWDSDAPHTAGLVGRLRAASADAGATDVAPLLREAADVIETLSPKAPEATVIRSANDDGEAPFDPRPRGGAHLIRNAAR